VARGSRGPSPLRGTGSLGRRGDPWVDAEDVAALGESVRSAGAVFQAHIYAGSGHLFTDPDLPEYDPASAGALQDRMLAFIEQL